MRIQHNIMAMNAYRNYTNNVSAMKANLEKLSSGYKINRAGDDAAGLAISEKMRAQITGLETAQKNAKDGISLVQTAEGALTEVHDMLNRMVELATQSANGTYDNETDRLQLQKEMDQLRDEINRIADSSNFNGIKLLDGSMDGSSVAGAGTVTVTNPIYDEDLLNIGTGSAAGTKGSLPAVTTGEVGTGTVLHKDPDGLVHGTEFSFDMHNVAFTNESGTTLSLNFDGLTISIMGQGGDEMTGEDIVNAIVDAIKYDDFSAVTFAGPTSGGTWSVTDGMLQKVDASGTTFTFEVKAGSNGDNRITFVQQEVPTTSAQNYDGYKSLTVTGGVVAKTTTVKFVENTTAAATATSASITVNMGATITSWSVTSAIGTTDAAGLVGTDITFTVDGADFTVTFTDDEETAKKTVGAVYVDKDIAVNDLVTNINNEVAKLVKAENNARKAEATDGKTSYKEIGTVALVADASNADQLAVSADVALKKMEYGVTGGSTPKDNNIDATAVKNVEAGDGPRLASTYFEITKDMVGDGKGLQIGKEQYLFTTDEAKKGAGGYVYVGDLGPKKDGQNLTDDDLKKVAQRLITAASANSTYTVGNESSSNPTRIQVVEIQNQKNFDLTTKEGIEESLKAFATETSTTVDNGTPATGKALTLQIGDTADSYNKLSVNIKDMHTSAMGIANISIADQESAAAAVDAIKAAINYVSDVRGTLGATQNRLDHTINNLSVMTENIQDAESTIRDTDVAEEMMAYTKNNILIQSAQAMLAQANQVPQGVLQLLQ